MAGFKRLPQKADLPWFWNKIFQSGKERWVAEMTDSRFLPSVVGYFQIRLTMSFLLPSSEVHFFSSKYAVPSSFITISKCTDAGEQLLSVRTKTAVHLHNYFSPITFPKQPEQKDRLRTAPETLLGRAGSSTVSSSQKMLQQQFPRVLTTVKRCCYIASFSPADLKALYNSSISLSFSEAQMIGPHVI